MHSRDDTALSGVKCFLPRETDIQSGLLTVVARRPYFFVKEFQSSFRIRSATVSTVCPASVLMYVIPVSMA